MQVSMFVFPVNMYLMSLYTYVYTSIPEDLSLHVLFIWEYACLFMPLMSVCIRVYAYVCMYTCVCTYVYVYVCIHTYAWIRVYVHMCMFTCTRCSRQHLFICPLTRWVDCSLSIHLLSILNSFFTIYSYLYFDFMFSGRRSSGCLERI